MIILLARFNKNLHDHDMFADEFYTAYESFRDEIELWQAEHGVKFAVNLCVLEDKIYGPVTAVTADFETDADFAMYKMIVNPHCIATSVNVVNTHDQDSWQFGAWTPTPYDEDDDLIKTRKIVDNVPVV